MIHVKHFMDTVEADDGQRIWVEPIGLTHDLRGWCCVQRMLLNVAPPRQLWEWFNSNPEGYEFFRGKYHEWLSRSPYMPALQELAYAGLHENLTLLHQGDHPEHNSAMALHDFLIELEAYCPPE